MKFAKLLAVLVMVGLMTFACAEQQRKIIADQPGYGVVSVEAPPAALPKVAEIKELVYFDFDKHEVLADSLPTLDKVADLMKANPDTFLVLSGHTDKVGSDNYNLDLSKDRALTVRNELVDRGVAKDMIKITWFGKNDLISKINKENRRVLILGVDSK